MRQPRENRNRMSKALSINNFTRREFPDIEETILDQSEKRVDGTNLATTTNEFFIR
jgi:hypothetical protein